MNTTNETLKSLIDRILRLKEEQDALGADIRDIYAEAKSDGFNKTALGQAITHIRKRAKDRERFEETNSDMELYLNAYYGVGTSVAPRAHETPSPVLPDSEQRSPPDNRPRELGGAADQGRAA